MVPLKTATEAKIGLTVTTGVSGGAAKAGVAISASAQSSAHTDASPAAPRLPTLLVTQISSICPHSADLIAFPRLASYQPPGPKVDYPLVPSHTRATPERSSAGRRGACINRATFEETSSSTRLGPHVVSTADRISARLGYRRDHEAK